ncbi:hypothetical protein ATANTOWER_007757 [Ataeniobius toweri]|uniref:Uncharacterized protein n=1 Tax=Ataeniobius toweri TaxID=208326 RepID=A0ABU7A4Z0_9TELE|nr:hypothetical protein [Ataeniobius toweri]
MYRFNILIADSSTLFFHFYYEHCTYLKTLILVLIIFRFIQDRVAGAASSEETPRLPSPQTPPPAPPGRAQGVPRPAERHNPSSMSWAIPWVSSRWDVPRTPPEKGVQEASGIDARATSTGSS